MNLDSQWAYDDAVLLRESLALEGKGDTKHLAVKFDDLAMRKKGKEWGGKATPLAVRAVARGAVTPMSGGGSKFSVALSSTPLTTPKVEGGAALVTGPGVNRVRSKGQPVGEIASSLEFPTPKRRMKA